MSLTTTTALCDAIVLLMAPLVEIVIHDLTTDRICYLNGKLSHRKIGGPSLLEKEDLDTDIDKIVYPKLNFDGRLVKSISIPLAPHWLICINCDVSVFSQMKNLSESFMQSSQSPQPESLFKNDWQEKLHITLHDFLQDKNWSFETLTSTQKKELVNSLFDLGAFAEKRAADYVADVLSMGRATVFKYLKERKQNETV